MVEYQNYEEYKQAVNAVLNRTVEDFVLTGYLLKKGRDTDILKNSGYSNVNEFAWAEYKLEATQVSRYIRINDRFSEGGYSPKLQEHYQGFGYAKLALMLTLPDSVAEELTPAYSKSEIQQVKEEIENEEKITDIEVILEGEKEEQRDLNNLEKAIHQLCMDEPELYLQLHETVRTTCGTQYLKEILAPDGDKIYSVRPQGAGRIMLYLNDEKEEVTLQIVRQGVKEKYTWDAILSYLTLITDQEEIRNIISTGNSGIDTILNIKISLAQRYGIEIRRNISIPAKIPIPYGHCVRIFGNLLDNAINALKDGEEVEKTIHLLLSFQANAFVIQVVNQYRDKPIKYNEDNFFHGLGLDIVKSTVEFYHGIFDIEDDGENFTVNIILYLEI